KGTACLTFEATLASVSMRESSRLAVCAQSYAGREAMARRASRQRSVHRRIIANACRCTTIRAWRYGDRGKQLVRKRGELLERPCAHLYETGGLRRMYVRGHENVLKRLLVHAGAFNLSLWMRTLFGIGTPRGLQGRL